MQAAEVDEQECAVGVCWTVGTYNVLHPVYAVKYKEKPGVDSEGQSNWPMRAEAIAAYILNARLDIYLLQEVGHEQLQDLMRLVSEHYEEAFFVHPGRQAGDGTAVITQRRCLEVVDRQVVPLPTTQNKPYMTATCVFARDRRSGVRLAILSAHLYVARGKCDDPEGRIVRFLQRCQGEKEGFFGRCDALIWGGDCNRAYPASGQGPPGFRHLPGGPRTHGSRQIDWIFFSSDILGLRGEAATEQFIASTQQVLVCSGYTVSDHMGEAVTLSYSGVVPTEPAAKKGNICASCPRLAKLPAFATCCQSCPSGHTAYCNKRNSCKHNCGRLLTAPHRNCCQACPDRHTKQCDLRQPDLERMLPLHESVPLEAADHSSPS